MRDLQLHPLDFSVPQPFMDLEIDEVRRRWRDCRAGLQATAVGRPFFVVTPLGLPLAEVIADAMARHQVRVSARTSIRSWPGTSTMVYARSDNDERLRVALIFERLWRAVSLAQRAERWDLRSLEDLRRLIDVKHELQEALGTVRIRVTAPDVDIRTPDHLVRLRALHVPDLDTVDLESRLLDTLAAGDTPT